MNKVVSAVSLLTLACISSAANSEESQSTETRVPVFIEAGYGMTKALDGCDGLMPGTTCDDTDTGFKVNVGAMVKEDVSFDLGYMDLGQITGNVQGIDVAIDVSAITAQGALYIPASAVDFFLKAGLAYSTVEADAQFGQMSASVDGNSLSTIFTAGIKIPVTKNISFIGEWDYLVAVGEDDKTGESDVSFLNAGLRLQF